MTERTFGDSIEPGLIPLDQVHGVLLYCDGGWPATLEHATAFEKAGKAIAWITTRGDWRNASICDVENGDMTPEDAALFVKQRDRFRPGSAIVYCNRATLPEVEQRCAGLTYWRFVADWTGEPHEPVRKDGSAIRRLLACQYVNHPTYDLTVWFRAHVHPDPSHHAAAAS